MAAVWSRINTVILLLVLFALLTLIGMVATGVRGGPLDPSSPPAPTDSVKLPGTPISGQTTISAPGHYYLTRDITVAGAQTAIAIAADDVSLDLGGFTIDGNDTAGSFGVLLTGARNDVVITNGTIKDFQIGLDGANDTRVTVDHVRAVSNVRGLQVGNFGTISHCVASGNTESGIYLPLLTASTTVSECTITGNAAGIGIDGLLGVVKNSVMQNHSTWDIHINQGSRMTIRDNTVDNMRIEPDSSLNYIFDNVCVQGGISNASGSTFAPAAPDPHYNVGC
jgi:hypothetical protein